MRRNYQLGVPAFPDNLVVFFVDSNVSASFEDNGRTSATTKTFTAVERMGCATFLSPVRMIDAPNFVITTELLFLYVEGFFVGFQTFAINTSGQEFREDGLRG